MNNKSTAITGAIKKHALEHPEKTALVIGDHRTSYPEFYRMVSSVALFLKRAGVKKGSHVLCVAEPNIKYIVCEYAVLGLGAINIPAENRVPVERLSEIACEVDAEFVLSQERPAGDAHWISYNEIALDGEADYTWEPEPVSNDCSEIIFTTGTTGKSKGVMLSSACLEAYLEAMNPSFGLNDDSVFLVATPLNHVGGLHRVHQCIAAGCTAVILDGFQNLKAFFNAIYENNVTHTYLPPAAVKMIILLAGKELAKLDGKLQFIYTASAPFPVADIEKLMALLPHTRLHQGYGSSETGSICNCCYNAPGETINSLGKPYPGVEVVLHDEGGRPILEPNKEGYIRSRSKMNMLGYYNEPELTASILKNGFIYSNDLMFFDEKGGLHFAGRGDDVVNIRGFKVSPVEIENTCLRYEKLQECVCVPYEDKMMGKVLKLYVVMKTGETFSEKEIVSYLSTRVEAYKLPKYVVEISEIPKTYNGKVDRKKLVFSGL